MEAAALKQRWRGGMLGSRAGGRTGVGRGWGQLGRDVQHEVNPTPPCRRGRSRGPGLCQLPRHPSLLTCPPPLSGLKPFLGREGLSTPPSGSCWVGRCDLDGRKETECGAAPRTRRAGLTGEPGAEYRALGPGPNHCTTHSGLPIPLGLDSRLKNGNTVYLYTSQWVSASSMRERSPGIFLCYPCPLH